MSMTFGLLIAAIAFLLIWLLVEFCAALMDGLDEDE